MRALLQGSPGRTPFAGHFRGRFSLGRSSLAWAGRVRGGATPEEAWLAAEAAREVMEGVVGDDRFLLVDTAWAALRKLDAPDLSVLLVAGDEAGVVVAACGLVDLRVDDRPVAPPGHPLFDDPGVRERPGYFHSESGGSRWVGLPTGMRWAEGDVALTCGDRSPA